MDWTVVDYLYQGVVLLDYVCVEQADQAIIATSKKNISMGWMKAQSCDLIVVFRVLPYLLVLSRVPRSEYQSCSQCVDNIQGKGVFTIS